MSRTQAVELVCKEQSGSGEIAVSTPAASQRIGKAVLLGSVMLLATVLSAFIPMVHFVAVPLLFVSTILVVVFSLQSREYIDSGTGSCPACNALFRIRRRRFSLPFSDVCSQCGRQVMVREPRAV